MNGIYQLKNIIVIYNSMSRNYRDLPRDEMLLFKREEKAFRASLGASIKYQVLVKKLQEFSDNWFDNKYGAQGEPVKEEPVEEEPVQEELVQEEPIEEESVEEEPVKEEAIVEVKEGEISVLVSEENTSSDEDIPY